MRREQTVIMKYIYPDPCYVIELKHEESLVFINICQIDAIAKPIISKDISFSGKSGFKWSIPHIFSYTYDDLEKCCIIDAVFNPMTIKLIIFSMKFKEICENTTFDCIKEDLNISVDRSSLRYPKLTYRGIPQRINFASSKFSACEESESILSKQKFPSKENITGGKNSLCLEGMSQHPKNSFVNGQKPQVPRYSIVYQADEDVQQMSAEKVLKNLLVCIHLPVLDSASEINLDIFEKHLFFEVKVPVFYKLDVELPVAVDSNLGKAKFDKSRRQLNIILPIVYIRAELNVASNDFILKLEQSELRTSFTESLEYGKKCDQQPDSHLSKLMNKSVILSYCLPEFECSQSSAYVVIQLFVRSVLHDFIQTAISEDHRTFNINFVAVESDISPRFYSFCAKFPEFMNIDDYTVDPSLQNIVILIPKNDNCMQELESIMAGKDEYSLSEEMFYTEDTLEKCLFELENDYMHRQNAVTQDDGCPNLYVAFSNEGKPTLSVTISNDGDLNTHYSYDGESQKVRLQTQHRRIHGILKRSLSESSDDAKPSGSSTICDTTGNEESDDTKLRKSVSFSHHVDTTHFKAGQSVASMKVALKSKRRRMRKRQTLNSDRMRHSSSECSSDDHCDTNKVCDTFPDKSDSKDEDEMNEKMAVAFEAIPEALTYGKNTSGDERGFDKCLSTVNNGLVVFPERKEGDDVGTDGIKRTIQKPKNVSKKTKTKRNKKRLKETLSSSISTDEETVQVTKCNESAHKYETNREKISWRDESKAKSSKDFFLTNSSMFELDFGKDNS